jgi:hypothetical protein
MSWDDLERRAGRDYPTAWMPDKNDEHPRVLFGTLVEYQHGPVSDYSDERPWIAVVEDRDDRLWSVWLNRAVLRDEFARRRPKPGERLAIAYKGRAKKKRGEMTSPAHLYNLAVDRPAEVPEFVAGEPEPGPSSDVSPVTVKIEAPTEEDDGDVAS